ncbi:MAG TPA: hypothetical protein PLW31_15445 [Bacteroidales bacterium]|nr:hypothetical protein [Bacteroidales bacterium]
MKSPILFIGYEPALQEEIMDYMKDRDGEAYFSSSAIETIRMMDVVDFKKVVLYMHRLEDAAILRYINNHYRNAEVLIMPDLQLQDAIPALADGHFRLLHEPFRLEELNTLI